MLALLALASCVPGGSPYGFIDQNLQGKIGGVAWSFVSGTADSTFIGGELYIELYNISPSGDPWAGGYAAAQDHVLFSVPATVGVYPLSLSQTATLNQFAGSMNYICTETAVEILSIDTTGLSVTGRINASYDGSTSVNGNFTALYR
jgi:hypothetical protein